MGGSRVSKAKVIRNTFIIFLVSGFWHGANWTFVAWGAFHALLFLPLIMLGKNRKNTNTVAEGRLLPSVKEFGQMALTFGLVVIGWVFFRADTITEAFDYFHVMFSTNLISVPWLMTRDFYLPLIISIVFLVIIEWLQRNKQHGLEDFPVRNKWIRSLFYFMLIISIFWFANEYQQFIYFQF